MKNTIQTGAVLTLTPAYDVASGAGCQVGAALFGVAADAVKSGAAGEFRTTGVFELKKTSALAISVGDIIYWDNTAKEVNKTNTNLRIGVAVAAAANPSATVLVKLGA